MTGVASAQPTARRASPAEEQGPASAEYAPGGRCRRLLDLQAQQPPRQGPLGRTERERAPHGQRQHPQAQRGDGKGPADDQPHQCEHEADEGERERDQGVEEYGERLRREGGDRPPQDVERERGGQSAHVVNLRSGIGATWGRASVNLRPGAVRTAPRPGSGARAARSVRPRPPGRTAAGRCPWSAPLCTRAVRGWPDASRLPRPVPESDGARPGVGVAAPRPRFRATSRCPRPARRKPSHPRPGPAEGSVPRGKQGDATG